MRPILRCPPPPAPTRRPSLLSAMSVRSLVRSPYAPCISKRTHLLSVPLGKPLVFYGEDYCMWSDKMRHHLTSLHTSIWDIVEFGAQVPSVGDEGYDSDEVAQI
jgi:hypothetical protein